MKQDVFLSKEEFDKRECLLKCRRERLIKVREQSKKMAATVLEKVKKEAEKQYQDTENRILSEIRDYYSKELASIRQHYDKCISEINQQHYMKEIGNTKRKTTSNYMNISLDKSAKLSSHEKSIRQQRKEVELKKSNKLDKNIDSKIIYKNHVRSSSPIKKFRNLKHTVQTVDVLPENVVIDSDEKSSEASNNNHYEIIKNQCFSYSSPKKNDVTQKKSVIFHNKENCESKSYDSKKNIAPNFFKKQNYSKNIEKESLQNIYEESNRNNMFNFNNGLNGVDEHRTTNEIYNRLVHDRIRILEQKEKILRKRTSPLTIPISSNTTTCKLNRFSEYFYNVRDMNATLNPVKKTQSTNCIKNNNYIDKENDTIENDLIRVQLKKQLLVLELSNAETQTEKAYFCNESMEKLNNECAVKKSCFALDDNITKKQLPSQLQEEINSDSFASKPKSPSPISKQHNDPKNDSMTVIKPKTHKTYKKQKDNFCRRKQSKNNKNVIVTISNNKTEVSTNNTDSDVSSPTKNCSIIQSSTESNEPIENCNSYKPIKVIVNVLPNVEYKKNKLSEKPTNIAYVTENNQTKKIQNWRKIFENEEKLTESSYFSPPDVITKKDVCIMENIKKSAKFSEKIKKQDIEPQLDVGYYIRKLLLMSPESIENLDVSSCSTAIVDEITENIPSKMKQIPIHIPMYQNSFDETLNSIFHTTYDPQQNDKIKGKSGNNVLLEEKIDFASSVLKKLVSSISSVSVSENKNLTDDENCSQKSKNLKKNDNYDRIHQKFSNSSKSSIEESDNISNHSETGLFSLPSVEELLKQGFILEPVIHRKSDEDDETIEEEEFIKEMLKINIQPNKVPEVKKENYRSSISPINEESLNNIKNLKTVQEQTNESKFSENTGSISCEISKKSKEESFNFRKENCLLGWMGTTVQRTLEASAINSTSSGDSCDPIRAAYSNVTNKTLELTTNNNSLSSTRFSLSPITVPDIHLNISHF